MCPVRMFGLQGTELFFMFLQTQNHRKEDMRLMDSTAVTSLVGLHHSFEHGPSTYHLTANATVPQPHSVESVSLRFLNYFSKLTQVNENCKGNGILIKSITGAPPKKRRSMDESTYITRLRY